MFSKIFIERPRFAMVISIIFVLMGIMAVTQLPIAEYPEIAPPQISVTTNYAGASAGVVADTVAIPIEDELNGVDDLLYFSSTCDNLGNYSCSVTFKSGTDQDMAMVNVQNALKRAEPKLPDDVKRVGVNVDKRTSDMLAVFVFTTDKSKMSVIELNNYVNTTIKDPISRIDGVAAAEVMSAQVFSMRIWLDPIRMAGLSVSTGEITAAIRRRDASIMLRETCAPDAPGAKSARTVYETVAACADASVVRAEPVTGRTHQLRVHFASLGCPIAGDGFYGTAETVPTAYDAAMTRQALHAVSLVIERTSGTLTLEAPPPPDIRALYEKIKES